MLPRTTGLVCPGFTGALPTMNPMRVEPIAGLPRDSSAFYLIQPDTTPFAYRQFRYFMNGGYTGELFLSANYKCQFRSSQTLQTTQDHGTWRFCNHIKGIVCHFDYAGRPDKARYKWTFFRGSEGIDYKCRQIYVYPVADWVWNPITNQLDRMEYIVPPMRLTRPRPELTLYTAASFVRRG